jgi:hypothetical protein
VSNKSVTSCANRSRRQGHRPSPPWSFSRRLFSSMSTITMRVSTAVGAVAFTRAS